jgi:hypothetical protein
MVNAARFAKTRNMKRSPRILPCLLVLGSAAVLALSLSACTGGGAAIVSATASPGASAGAASGAPQEVAPYPLDAYIAGLSGLSGNVLDNTEREFQLDTKREAVVAACMKDKGFSYTSEAVKETSGATVSAASDEDLNSLAWVQKYGYGDVYLPDGATGEIQRAQVANKSARETAPNKNASPNSQYKASLTPDEQKAYETALYGDNGKDDSLTVAHDWKRLGCNGKGLHEVKNELAVMGSSQGVAVTKAMNQLFDGYWSWPGIVRAQKLWSSCMATGGFAGYDRQDQPLVQFADQNSALWEGLAAGAQPPASALDSLAKSERAVAVVDLNCRVKTNYAATIRDVRISHEKQFMSDNKALLDALTAATATTGNK